MSKRAKPKYRVVYSAEAIFPCATQGEATTLAHYKNSCEIKWQKRIEQWLPATKSGLPPVWKTIDAS